jgi:hypothetical protein
MKRIPAARLGTLLTIGIALFLTACSGGGGTSGSSSGGPLNLAGTWTATVTSTEGQGTFTGNAAVTQSGEGLGVNGSTTLSAPGGQVVLSQTGTALTGKITNSVQSMSFNFTGTLSSGNLTLTGSTSCGTAGTQTLAITGTITSSAVKGTYKLTRPSGCYYASDAGSFTATKQ